jgi:hypothetical protein
MLSILGLARASSALGERDTARGHYERLLANLADADSGVPEVAEAKAYLAAPPPSVWRPTLPIVGGSIVAVAVVSVSVAIYRRRWSATPHRTKVPDDGARQRRKRNRR